MARVPIDVEFRGVARSAVAAARQTRNEIAGVGSQARRAEQDLGKLSRGVVAGSGVFRGLGRSIAFASAGFLGGYGLTAAIGGAVHELRESIRVTAQTNQALRSTGAVAGITARGIDQLAQSLLRKTGVDDEATKTSANLLLTFTQVRNEAGRGNDVFNQSVKAVVDMSAVIGDLSSNSIQLGKALNDPVAGMTALRRVGVSFTAQQREQIAALMKHGEILRAQKIILAEVRREFGGQAAAQEKATGGLNILRESIKNTSADLLRALLPSFRDLIASLQKQVDWLQNTREGQAKLRSVSHSLKQAFEAMVESIKLLIGGIKFVDRVTGSFKRTVELLIALKMAVVISGWAGALGLSKGGLAANLGIATGEAQGLRGALARLPRRLVIQLVIATAIYGPAKKFFEQQLGADYSGIQPDVPGRGKSPYPRGSTLDRLYQAGYSQAKVGTVGGFSGKTVRDLDAAERKAYEQGVQAARTAPGSRKARSTANAIAATAASQLGISYQWGGPAILGHSTDCSGLTQAVLRKNGISVGRTTYEQWRQGRPVDPKHLQPGDLVFFNMGRRGPEHVGVYIGNGQFIEDPHTGASVRVSNLAGRRDFVGARRYIPNILGGKTAPAQEFTPHDPAALATPSKKTGSKGATLPTIIGVRASIDATLRLFENLAPNVEKYLSPLAGIAERHLEALRAHLRKGMSAVDLAKTRAGIKYWGDVLRKEITKAKDKAAEAAGYAAEAASRAWDRRWRDTSTVVFRRFDRETDQYVKGFQRDTDRAVNEMRKTFERQMRAFDEETRRGLQGFVVGQTPQEAALAQFQAARQAEQDAKAMADALASGDPEQVRQLQLDLQERALEAAAQQSRDAQDKATEEAQRNYQQQRDDQRAALEEQEAQREQAFQDQREVTLAAYQQMRDDQRQHLQDDLDDWVFWITNKKKTWADFLLWLAQEGFTIPGDMLNPPDELVAKRLWEIGLRPTGVQEGPGFASGGTVRAPRYVNRGDVIPARLSHGETVIDRSLTEKLDAALSGGWGSSPTIVFKDARFLGTGSREVSRELARIVAPELDRRIVYRAP
jgi:cell wall-associated NlpC family hydrolase